jgi:hypothetical protein
MRFFGEGLPKLGVVNLEVELDTQTSGSTTIFTSTGGSNVVLQNNTEPQIIPLPSPTPSAQTFTFRPNESIISARIPATPSSLVTDPKSLLSAEDIQSLWACGGKLSCATCHKPLIEGREMKWKDLPSESWKEYADYWLCHRHAHSHAHSHTPTHDPPAIPVLKATAGTALVGLTFLLVDPYDTQNLQIKVILVPASFIGGRT